MVPQDAKVKNSKEYNRRAAIQTQVYGKLFALCEDCGMPLEPCPKGPGADNPGYVGFYNCCKGKAKFTRK